MKADPTGYKAFMEQPCEVVAQDLAGISADSEIESLLKLYEKTKFGFVWVEGPQEAGALVSLRDFLGLYDLGILKTTMTMAQVASPIYSMSPNSPIREVLNEMFDRRVRRIFIADEPDQVITDRQIISYVFSTSQINEVTNSSRDMLKTRLKELEKTRAERLRGSTKIVTASRAMKEEIEECFVCESGVVTPWDMIIKPWKQGKLKIN